MVNNKKDNIDDWVDVPLNTEKEVDDWVDVPLSSTPMVESEPVTQVMEESMTSQSGIPDVGSIEEELLAGKYKDTAPSPVSAALRGALNEASYDIADELAAVAELGATKLSDLVTGTPSKYESLIKQYQDIRNVKRKGSKELEEAFPTESLAGRLAGAGVLAALSGGASIPASLAKQATKQGVKQAAVQAAKLGAKYGAAQGVGKSEAEVLEGELGDLAGDISSEALLGGAAGGIIPTIVPAAKGAASTVKKGLEMLPGYESMKTGFELGKEGIVASAKTLGAEYKKIADDITKKIKTKLETAGVSKAQALELADQMQITMNAGADVQTAIEKASRSVGVDDNQKRQYIEFLKRTMGEDVDLAKATQQLEQKRAVAIEKASREGKQLQTTTEINKDVGDVLIDPDLQGRVVGFQDKLVKVGKDGKSTTSKLVTLKTLKDPDIPVTARDMENLTPSEMTEFLKDINQYTGNLNNKAANEVERNARQLASQINQKLNTALQSTDVAALNNEMANLFNAIKNLRMPGNVTSKNKMVFDEQVAQVQKRLMDISDQGKVDKELIFKRLAEASPDFTTAEKRIQLLDEYKKIAEKGTGAGGFGLEALLGSAQRRATTAANIAGRASKTISEVNPSKVLREAGKALTESTPQAVQNLITKVQANPKFKSFLPALQDAANATTDTARKVILDNLNTQPAFREMMRSMDMGIQPTSPEESEAPMQENLQSSTSNIQDLLQKYAGVAGKGLRSLSNAIIPEAAAADSPLVRTRPAPTDRLTRAVINILEKKEGKSGDKTGAAKTGALGVTDNARKAVGMSDVHKKATTEQEQHEIDKITAEMYVDLLHQSHPNIFKNPNLTEAQKETFLYRAYNQGPSFLNSTAVKLASQGSTASAADKLLEYANVRGMLSKGVARSLAEDYNNIKSSDQKEIAFVRQNENSIEYLDKDGNVIKTLEGYKHPENSIGTMTISGNPVKKSKPKSKPKSNRTTRDNLG